MKETCEVITSRPRGGAEAANEIKTAAELLQPQKKKKKKKERKRKWRPFVLKEGNLKLDGVNPK